MALMTRLAARHATLRTYVDTYALDPVVAEHHDTAQDAVTVTTVHAARGTEVRVAYVEASSRYYPHPMSRREPDAVEEERRVLYVAITRAVDELIVIRAGDFFAETAGPDAFLSAPPDGLFAHEWIQRGSDLPPGDPSAAAAN